MKKEKKNLVVCFGFGQDAPSTKKSAEANVVQASYTPENLISTSPLDHCVYRVSLATLGYFG
jgi:hypothetical protein